MKRIITTALVAAAVLATPAIASADVSTNGTTNDAYGYCIANHIANFNTGFNGVGHVRSAETGKQTAAQSGNRAPSICVTTQGDYAPISGE